MKRQQYHLVWVIEESLVGNRAVCFSLARGVLRADSVCPADQLGEVFDSDRAHWHFWTDHDDGFAK